MEDTNKYPKLIMTGVTKLRRAGSRGYLVSLPNEYVAGAKIHPGQKFAMYRLGDNLLLVPEASSAKENSPYQSTSQNPT